MLRIEYQLTLADLTEANKAAVKAVQKKSRGGLAGWMMFGVLVTAMVFLLESTHSTTRGTTGPSIIADPEPPRQNLWTILAPPLVVAGFLFVAVFISGIDNRRRAIRALKENSSPSQLPPLKALGYLSLIPFLALILPNVPALAVYWHPDPGMIEMAAFAPWIVFVFVLIGLNRLNRRWAVHKLFAQQRSIRRPIKLEATESQLAIDDGLNYFRYDWSTFDRYAETENLLKLVTEDETALLIPKRAMPDLADLDMLRGLIQTKIARGTFLPRDPRFPVLPAPVIPLESSDATDSKT
jgi:hypothetical protein